ncbi:MULTISPECIES: YhgE/Pip family protein [Streptomyces violaceusniger group]|uniref:YhgE/Pip domain-containing protein n=2 Tax=Streptomyces javensis TaxID=114698 RepID=A0ABS0R9K5_9ACTN|nr:YhgE/Pip domain-containing protein [Streptomyces javensis]MBI0314081.1 YhgE/Pip domain-containing protein [Streptomyces javensis]
MRSPKLAALELKRFGRGKLPRAALAALLLLPLLYGALYLWSFWDPYGKLNKIPVALVNSDTGATVQGKHLTAGDDITDKLLDSETFDWHPTSAAEARKGVANGTYYLSLTVPSDFSRQIASSSGKSPETGALKVRTNDANNYIVGQISRSVFSEVRAAASTKASRGFYDNIFISFADIHGETEKAAKSADKLGKGIGKAKKGADDLAKGLAKAKEGSRDLKSGLGTLYKGSGTLETGAGGVADGTQSLSDKVNGVAAKVRPFLKEHGKEIGDISQLVADASQKASDNLDTLPEKTSTAATKARKASDDLAADYRTRCGGAVPTDPDCPALKKSVAAADTAADVAEDVNKLVQDHTGQLDTLGGHLDDLHDQALWLARKAPHLDTDLDSAVRKINTLNSGAQKVAKGAGTLHTGLSTAKTGASDLDSGVGKARGGADTLGGGMYRLVDGSGKLSGGLHDGAGKIPDYGKQDRDARTEVMSDPVRLVNQALHKAPNYGTGFAPYFIPLSLWVGAMVAYMLIQPLNGRALAAGASSWRTAFAGWLPVATIGVLQTLALMAVLHWAIGLEMVRTAGTLGFLMLVTACFTAIVQWLNARFGPAGRILVLALLMLQLTSAGGTYPVQTSPRFFNAIHPFLPMTYVVDGLRRLITGGGLGPVWLACGVLLGFTAAALALTAWSARRRQVWTVDRLHPELSL